MNEAAQQRAARAKRQWQPEKRLEKERQKREAILAKQKVLAEKAAKEDRKAEKKPKKNLVVIAASGHFLAFIKRKSSYNEEVEKNMIFLSISILFLREQQHEK
ncbi:hypothetical protein SAZ89_02610 [Limosilactobacillus reuteri]|nr:hypothetical protein [Limosilactobacillus reuteri]